VIEDIARTDFRLAGTSEQLLAVAMMMREIIPRFAATMRGSEQVIRNHSDAMLGIGGGGPGVEHNQGQAEGIQGEVEATLRNQVKVMRNGADAARARIRTLGARDAGAPASPTQITVLQGIATRLDRGADALHAEITRAGNLLRDDATQIATTDRNYANRMRELAEQMETHQRKIEAIRSSFCPTAGITDTAALAGIKAQLPASVRGMLADYLAAHIAARASILDENGNHLTYDWDYLRQFDVDLLRRVVEAAEGPAAAAWVAEQLQIAIEYQDLWHQEALDRWLAGGQQGDRPPNMRVLPDYEVDVFLQKLTDWRIRRQISQLHERPEFQPSVWQMLDNPETMWAGTGLNFTTREGFVRAYTRELFTILGIPEDQWPNICFQAFIPQNQTEYRTGGGQFRPPPSQNPNGTVWIGPRYLEWEDLNYAVGVARHEVAHGRQWVVTGVVEGGGDPRQFGVSPPTANAWYHNWRGGNYQPPPLSRNDPNYAEMMRRYRHQPIEIDAFAVQGRRGWEKRP